MKHLILPFILLTSIKAFSIIGHDDRFYINKTKWGKLLNGIIQINDACTGFVLEGDIVITAAHCFKEDIDYEEDGAIDIHSPITKDSKIDIKKVKQTQVLFGDVNFDENDESKKTHFNESSEFFPAKDLFLGHNPKEPYFDDRNKYSNDYAFIKLEKPIPKEIKRFKLFNADLLKEYEILKHPDRGNLSTAGFHGDNTKTAFQRMAHIGCKVRDMKEYKKVWLEYSDCDTYSGASGSPLFYILRHKKTKKIELAVSSIIVSGAHWPVKRKLENQFFSKDNQKQRYQLGWGQHYKSSIYFFETWGGRGSSNISLALSNHKDFLSNLKKFKKDPSFFRNKKISKIAYSKYNDETWILKNIQKKSLKELKEFLHKTFLKLKDKDIESLYYFYKRVDFIHKNKKNLSKEKLKLLEGFLSYSESDAYKTSPIFGFSFKTRPKQFSFDKLTELEDKFERKDPDTYEDTINDKEKAQKLWDMYFLKEKKKGKKLKDLYFFK